jgi:hypothetical protein
MVKLREIKKYLDSFFRELREFGKEIRNAKLYNLRGAIDPAEKSEQLKQMIKKVYNSIRYKHSEIEHYLKVIYCEYKELSLIHESKIGHSLKDMEQFLAYYKSTDENILRMQNKLAGIIDRHKRQMEIEIFGENPLSCDSIKNNL